MLDTSAVCEKLELQITCSTVRGKSSYVAKPLDNPVSYVVYARFATNPPVA